MEHYSKSKSSLFSLYKSYKCYIYYIYIIYISLQLDCHYHINIIHIIFGSLVVDIIIPLSRLYSSFSYLLLSRVSHLKNLYQFSGKILLHFPSKFSHHLIQTQQIAGDWRGNQLGSPSMAAAAGGKSLEQTPTWAVAVVCFVLLLISIFIEYSLHLIGHVRKEEDNCLE